MAQPMTFRTFHPDGYAAPAAPYSAVVGSGELIFVSGQVPLDPAGRVVDGGIAEHASQVHANLVACLAAAGCSLADVVKTTVYLAQEEDFDTFNAVYASWFDDPLPARTAVRAGLMRGFLVEVDVIARVPEA